MTTQDVLTTEQVASRFYQFAQEGQWQQIQDELFSQEARSIEPPGAEGFPEVVAGLDKIREKGRTWEELVEQVHSGYCREPQVAGNYFACAMGTDVTMKGKGRTAINEIALYEVRDGKIISEQFFY
jgi:ketosteroid isomerase-like protein